MEIAQALLYVLVGLIVLAEAVNKLERTDIFAPNLGWRSRLEVVLKAAGWCLLALGAGGLIVSPVMPQEYVQLGYAAAVAGFAMLVVRSRLRETPAGQRRIESDEFERTQVFRRP